MSTVGMPHERLLAIQCPTFRQKHAKKPLISPKLLLPKINELYNHVEDHVIPWLWSGFLVAVPWSCTRRQTVFLLLALRTIDRPSYVHHSNPEHRLIPRSFSFPYYALRIYTHMHTYIIHILTVYTLPSLCSYSRYSCTAQVYRRCRLCMREMAVGLELERVSERLATTCCLLQIMLLSIYYF